MGWIKYIQGWRRHWVSRSQLVIARHEAIKISKSQDLKVSRSPKRLLALLAGVLCWGAGYSQYIENYELRDYQEQSRFIITKLSAGRTSFTPVETFIGSQSDGDGDRSWYTGEHVEFNFAPTLRLNEDFYTQPWKVEYIIESKARGEYYKTGPDRSAELYRTTYRYDEVYLEVPVRLMLGNEVVYNWSHVVTGLDYREKVYEDLNGGGTVNYTYHKIEIYLPKEVLCLLPGRSVTLQIDVQPNSLQKIEKATLPLDAAYVPPPLIPGSIARTSEREVPSGTMPGIIQSTAPAEGSTGNYSYQWKMIIAGTDVNAPGLSTSANYSPGALTQPVIFYRAVTDGCATERTGPVDFMVYAPLLPGIIGADHAILAGVQPADREYCRRFKRQR